MNDREVHNLFSRIGAIEKWLEGIDKKLGELNGTTAANAKAIQRHDVFLGKVGVVTAMIALVASACGWVGSSLLKFPARHTPILLKFIPESLV